MAHPRGNDWLEDEIKTLRQAGIDVLISLLTHSEIRELKLIAEPDLCLAEGIEYLALPVIDRQVPPFQPATFDFLARLNDLLMQGKHLVIHCRMGIGRSALVAASLLVITGMTTDNAFEHVAEARGFSVPDTDDQKEWVLRFENYLVIRNN